MTKLILGKTFLFLNQLLYPDLLNIRFDYSKEFLLWALTPPGYVKDLHIGVRATKSRCMLIFVFTHIFITLTYSIGLLWAV